MCRKGAELMPLPFKEKSNHTSSKQHEKTQTQKEQSHDVPLLFLSTTPMHLPRLWTDAPVAKSKSRGEQNSKGSKGSTQGPQQTQPEKEGRGNQQHTTRKRGQVWQPQEGAPGRQRRTGRRRLHTSH